jgi:hypothetical protein
MAKARSADRIVADLVRFLNTTPDKLPDLILEEVGRWRRAPRVNFRFARVDDAEILQNLLVWQKCLQSLALRIQEGQDSRRNLDLAAGKSKEAFELLENFVSDHLLFRCKLTDEVAKAGKTRKTREYRVRPASFVQPPAPRKPWPDKWKAFACDLLIRKHILQFLDYLDRVYGGEKRRIRLCSTPDCGRYFLQKTATNKTCGRKHPKKKKKKR